MAKWEGYTWDTPPSATGAPSRLAVATCQIPVEHDIARNLQHILELVRRAAAAGADVAHFPECALSGYGPASWPDWQGFDWSALDAAVEALRAEARASGIWVVVGSVHRASPQVQPTNSLLVIDRQGEIAGRYDKRRCSVNDLRAFAPGESGLTVAIEGVHCGFLICLDWAFPELWQAYAGEVELVFHSCISDNVQRDRIEAHAIRPLLQGYAWLHQYAVSCANSCRPRQNFPSFWIERSGHAGKQMSHDQIGFVANALMEDPAQDRFFDMIRRFRASATDGSLYAPHRAGKASADGC
ncbi:carbon-nitrogen hydrolase family protein [Chelativorans xinjiangense]|uniref:carbon-nitrogen hydrolase family protein n=1 Tax=Chelativorans xinjiangense TaxID=2681485 RepID=UPI00135C653A|nr:carbon-nitrogen hydrolase family protein [Chelativorans xinjiangense]